MYNLLHRNKNNIEQNEIYISIRYIIYKNTEDLSLSIYIHIYLGEVDENITEETSTDPCKLLLSHWSVARMDGAQASS